MHSAHHNKYIIMILPATQVDASLGQRGIGGALNAQLLLQLETDALLGLMAHQLAASIPASYPDGNAASDFACQLGSSLGDLWQKVDLHKLPLPAAYTGPQVALQVMPSALCDGGAAAGDPLRPDPGAAAARTATAAGWWEWAGK